MAALMAGSMWLTFAFSANAQTSPDLVADTPPEVLAPVLFSYATLVKEESTQPMCWQVLTPQRDVLIRERNAKPWLVRNWMPIAGAVMGGVVGGLVLKHHYSAAIVKKLRLPVVAGSAAAGYLLGPGAVAGFVVGGGITDYALRGAVGRKLGKGKVPITIGAAVGGAAAGKKLWEKIFPPDVPEPPAMDPEGDVDVEVFVRDQVCGKTTQVAYSQSLYRVGYRFNGEELVAELPYDPGEALRLTSTGNITGPARVRLD